ncbi:MAG: ArsA family ATPase [Acidimicrobiia bacterium]
MTGKGGVGKTTVSAALALLAAEHGKRVLVVEVDAKGEIAASFEHKPVGFDAVEVAPGVSALQMDTEASLREYLKLNLKVPVFGRLGPVASTFDFLATAAPGIKEILTVGKVCWEVREAIAGRADWDLVVVDAPATGHIIGLLDAPRAIQELVRVGPVRTQTNWMLDLLTDPAVTQLCTVTTPEEMPVNETIELVAAAQARLDVALGPVVVNRVLPELFTRADEQTFEALREADARQVLLREVGHGSTAVLDGARLAVSLRRTRAQHLRELRDRVDLPLMYVPYLFTRRSGMRVVRAVADALGAEL